MDPYVWLYWTQGKHVEGPLRQCSEATVLRRFTLRSLFIFRTAVAARFLLHQLHLPSAHLFASQDTSQTLDIVPGKLTLPSCIEIASFLTFALVGLSFVRLRLTRLDVVHPKFRADLERYHCYLKGQLWCTVSSHDHRFVTKPESHDHDLSPNLKPGPMPEALSFIVSYSLRGKCG